MNTYFRSFEVLANHFREDKHLIQVDAQAKNITFNVGNECAIYICTIGISPAEGKFAIKLTLPLIVSEPKMQEQFSEAIWLANKNVAEGASFSLELPEGLISYEFACGVDILTHIDSLIDPLLAAVVYECNAYFPAFMRVRYGGLTPEDAIFMSELDDHAESGKDGADLGGEDAGTQSISSTLVKPDAKDDHATSGSCLQRVWQTIRRLRALLLDEDMLCLWVMVMKS